MLPGNFLQIFVLNWEKNGWQIHRAVIQTEETIFITTIFFLHN